MIIYEIDSIVNFLAHIPNLIAFPITFLFSAFLVLSFVGAYALIVLLIFAIITVILAVLDRKVMQKKVIYREIGS